MLDHALQTFYPRSMEATPVWTRWRELGPRLSGITEIFCSVKQFERKGMNHESCNIFFQDSILWLLRRHRWQRKLSRKSHHSGTFLVIMAPKPPLNHFNYILWRIYSGMSFKDVFHVIKGIVNIFVQLQSMSCDFWKTINLILSLHCLFPSPDYVPWPQPARHNMTQGRPGSHNTLSAVTTRSGINKL